ncbi:MAG TPA: peptidoglycan editing factor PgeF [Polyangiaceae bacterium]
MSPAEYLTSPLLTAAGFRHAFFTRRGGVSKGPFSSLSFSVKVGDTPENVARNLDLAGACLGVARAQLFFSSQVHGNVVRELDRGDTPEEVLFEAADALVTDVSGLACSVRTADCVPVLIADPRSGVVAAAHAGWRGVVCGILAETVATLERRGAASQALIAAIGPHISCAAFEVSEEVAGALADAAGDSVVDRARGPKPHVDLRQAVRLQLTRLGLACDAIEDVPGCTYGDPERFFSFRRDGAESGRHISAIVARSARP